MNGGYIVIDGNGRPLMLGSYDDSPMILLYSHVGTIFQTYEGARCAVRRTLRYSKRNGFDWGDYRAKSIMRVRWGR